MPQPSFQMCSSGSLLLYIQNHCDNPVPITTGTIQTITSPQAHPPIALETKPLELVNVPVIDVIVVAPGQEVAFLIIITTEIATTNQLLIATKARIIMPILLTTLGIALTHDPILMVGDILLAIMDCIFMMTTSNLAHNSSLKKKLLTSCP